MSGIMQLLLSGRPQVASDPYFEYTTLLLPGNGTNGAQNNTFLDSSTNAFSITRNGNTTQGTFSPFSQTGWGNYFDGTGDYLDAGSNSAFSFGTGAYTVEAWVFVTARSSSGSQIFANDTTGGFAFEDDNSLGLLLYSRGTANILSAGSSNRLPLNSWAHVAIVRSGTGSNQTAIYLNGTQVALGTDSTNWTVTGPAKIGSISTAGYDLNGYISNFRVVKGTAVYTSNFTPPTTPLTAITNTSLLTCQSNRFIDNSTNNFAITRNGDVSVQAFSPFNPTAAWSAATNGGSGYFDGSGDYISAPSNAAFALPGDFTFEAWIYPTSWSASVMPVFVVYLSTIGGLWVGKNGSNFVLRVAGVADQLTTTTLPTLNAWTHIAVVRSGTTATIYYNGVSIVSGTVTYSFVQEQANVAGDTTGSAFSGYISSLRLVKGTAVYTSAFTPPAAPLTAITNTSLLTNFTNAGIYDATSKNDLETVGNAQISTTQSKFGGSSMSFDGSGDRAVLPFFPWLQMGSGDWTIEMWLYINAAPGGGLYFNLYANRASTGNFSPIAIFVNSARNIEAYFSTSGSGWTSSLTTSGTISTSTWTHVAVVRNGSTVKVYFNGTADATTTTISGALFANTSPLFVGGEAGGNDLNGYINDYRVTKGYARYTSTFTPPTAAFPLF